MKKKNININLDSLKIQLFILRKKEENINLLEIQICLIQIEKVYH